MPENQAPSPVASDLASPFFGRRTGHAYNPPAARPTEDVNAQIAMLEALCREVFESADIQFEDIMEKEAFRLRIEGICREAIRRLEIEESGNSSFPVESVRLRCFGSLASGFATKAADLDLGLFSPYSTLRPDNPESPIPRLIEKAFLDAGLGARLLTRTRVPIIKLCEKPPESLRRQLLLARERWERGLDTEAGEASQDKAGEADNRGAAEDDDEHEDEDDAAPERLSNPDSETCLKVVSLLKQDSRPLADYYQAARATLRKLGGRDLPKSTVTPFTGHDIRVLNKVARAFVSGLSDSELRGRLLSYSSLGETTATGAPLFRSLEGVYMQCQGEYLVMNWERKPMVKPAMPHDMQATNDAVSAWLQLQDTHPWGADPVRDNAVLKKALDRLMKLPYMQLLSLQQGKDDAKEYIRRANSLLHTLGGHDAGDATTTELRQLFVMKFANGIKDKEIRSAVSAFAEDNQIRSLATVARRFRSLWLARDYEKAIELDIIDKDDLEDVQAYIAILRRPMKEMPAAQGGVDYFVPTSADEMQLLKRIRLIGDPSAKLQGYQRNRLEFPKTGAGVQCDINFSAHLAIRNTQLLRCYAHTDPRVRPLGLFVKHWAKKRGINTPYKGTLSSYGYVLMVLHYLVNVAKPFVCPNLQLLAPPPRPGMTMAQMEEEELVCQGHNVAFWRDEAEIQRLAAANALNHNRLPVGALLRGFFDYFANHHMATAPGRGFDWGRDVLSLRTPGGLLTKAEKGWTGAVTVVTTQLTFAPQTPGPDSASSIKSPPPLDNGNGTPGIDRAGSDSIQQLSRTASTLSESDGGETTTTTVTTTTLGSMAATSSSSIPQKQQNQQQQHTRTPSLSRTTSEVKEVRHRYLFAIEDPFELDHNVARTVNRAGVTAIRDEFRRAWRLIRNAGPGPGQAPGEGPNLDALLEDAGLNSEETQRFSTILSDLHGLPSLSQRSW